MSRYHRAGGGRSSPIEVQADSLTASRFLILACCALAVALLAVACGAARNASTGTPAPTPTPKDAHAIRDLDLTQLPAAQTLLQQLGSGSIDPRAVIYTDLTGDGRDEAIVPVTSGGTSGNIAYIVLTMKAGKPQVILSRTRDRSTAGGLKMTVENGVLTETAAEFANEDPLCCPSQLRRTDFRWDGSQLQVAGEARVQQTPAKQ